ncbi:translationally controlled tumor-associated [Ascodesmis nigricans]|uniref:Translationally-controlled tumor protein homolog n=1 Tax=Ascodesmis nigricans TaxID=341454 RepID=A0A4V3SI72_9PEZI|nr:translationally controlled tumor-associated [Ascodesmis nigricans]
MIIYKDIISGDELISDVYDLKEVDGVLYEADCQMITIKKGADVDIGANPSAEGGDEGGDDEGTETVNNVVYSFRLSPSSFDKKSYKVYLGGYMKKIKAALEAAGKSADEIAAFQKGAQTAAKKILENFKDYEFYVGEGMDPDAMVVLLNYREDGVTPFMTFWKHGLKEEKV